MTKYDWRWSVMQPLLAEVRRIQDGVYLKSYANGSGGVSDSYGQDLLLFDADQDPLAVIRDWIEKHRPWPRCEQNNNSGVIVVYRDTTTIGEAYYRDGKPKPDCDAMYQWSCENRDGWHWLPDGVEPNVIREHREHEAAKTLTQYVRCYSDDVIAECRPDGTCTYHSATSTTEAKQSFEEVIACSGRKRLDSRPDCIDEWAAHKPITQVHDTVPIDSKLLAEYVLKASLYDQIQSVVNGGDA